MLLHANVWCVLQMNLNHLAKPVFNISVYVSAFAQDSLHCLKHSGDLSRPRAAASIELDPFFTMCKSRTVQVA